MRLWFWVLGSLCAVFGVFGGFLCWTPVQKRPLTLVLSREPEALMFSTYETMATQLVKKALFRNLVEWDDAMQPVAELVESLPQFAHKTMQILADGTLGVWWQLKKGLKWSDGAPLTTQDILFTYRLLSNPQLPAYSRARKDVQMIQELRVIDDLRFVVIWKRPYAHYEMSFQIYPKHILEKELLKPQQLQYSQWNRAPVGNGPYRVKEWRPGEYILLERNPFFHRPVHLEHLAFQFVRNVHAALIRVLSGQADIVVLISPGQRLFLQREHSDRVVTHKVSGMGWIHVDMNLENPILKNRRIRHALLYAIDRKQILKKIFFNDFDISASCFPQKHLAYTQQHNYPYNPEKALQILRAEGWVQNSEAFFVKDGKVLKLRLLADSKNMNRIRVAMLLQEYWRRIGVDVQLQFFPATVFMSRFLVPRDFDMALYAWYMSPDTDGQAYWSREAIPRAGNGFFGLNFAGFSHPRVEQIYRDLPFLLHRQKRNALFADLQALWMRELPALPLFVTSSLSAVTQGVKNWRPSGTLVPETWNCEMWGLGDLPQE